MMSFYWISTLYLILPENWVDKSNVVHNKVPLKTVFYNEKNQSIFRHIIIKFQQNLQKEKDFVNNFTDRFLWALHVRIWNFAGRGPSNAHQLLNSFTMYISMLYKCHIWSRFFNYFRLFIQSSIREKYVKHLHNIDIDKKTELTFSFKKI